MLDLVAHRFNCRWHDGTFSPTGAYFSLVDERGRVSLFGTAIPSDAYDRAADCQFDAIDWHPLSLDEATSTVLDLQTGQTAIGHGPSINQDRLPNPHQCNREEIVSPVHVGDELKPLIEAYQRQYKLEREHFDRELAAFPPASLLKPPRARRRRLVYGSEDEVETPQLLPPPLESEEVEVVAAQSESESSANEDEDEDAPIRAGHRLRRRTGEARRRQRELVASWIVPLSEDDEAYRPVSTAAASRRRPRNAGGSRRGLGSEAAQPAQWVSSNDRHSFPYLPQLGDAVVYFPEGHRQFLERERSVAYRHQLPWQQIERLPTMVFGIVEAIDWHATGTASMPRCQLRLVMVEEAELPSHGREELSLAGDLLKVFLEDPLRQRLTVVYRECEGVPDFIILHCLYRWSQLMTYRVGDEVKVVFTAEESFPARITRVRRAHHSPWQCYTVAW